MLVQPWLKRKLLQLIPFVLTALVFGIIYALIEWSLMGDLDHYPSTNNPYHFTKNSVSTILQALSMGTLLGIGEVFLFENLFKGHHFILKFIFKSILYILAILVLVALFSMISTSVIEHISLFHPMVWHNVRTFFTDMMFWVIMIYIGAVFSVTILITEMSHHLGDGVFRKFLFGKYQQPHEEERIFMFLDMKGSTALAENMGHLEYFNFLND
jgi:adenylate cyclase